MNFDVAEVIGVQPNVSAVVQAMSSAKLGYLALRHSISIIFYVRTGRRKCGQVRSPAESLRQVQFATLDLMRRAQGHALGAIGFDPVESPHRRLASGDHWRLRDYGGPGPETSLLIIAAPIKRPYIWDLGPNVSAIRYCLSHGVRVYLVEWIAPTPSGGHVGLDEVTQPNVNLGGCRPADETQLSI
jgi:hypothetical protein